jgi:hypothetical protein
MSRFQEWTSAERGLGKFASTHIELDFRSFMELNWVNL